MWPDFSDFLGYLESHWPAAFGRLFPTVDLRSVPEIHHATQVSVLLLRLYHEWLQEELAQRDPLE